jgi:hypothetical protein
VGAFWCISVAGYWWRVGVSGIGGFLLFSVVVCFFLGFFVLGFVFVVFC